MQLPRIIQHITRIQVSKLEASRCKGTSATNLYNLIGSESQQLGLILQQKVKICILNLDMVSEHSIDFIH